MTLLATDPKLLGTFALGTLLGAILVLTIERRRGKTRLSQTSDQQIQKEHSISNVQEALCPFSYPSKPKNATSIPPEITAIIKATTPIVAPLVPAIVKTFYATLFEKHPETKNFFPKVNMSNGVQHESLGASLTAAVVNVEDLSVLSERLTQIFHRHVGLGVIPGHYLAVHGCLMDAVALEVPDEYLKEEVVEAWSNFILLLAGVFIDAEEKLYQDCETRGWRGFKDLKLIGKDVVGKDVVTFTFETEMSIDFKAGQYITVVTPSPEESWGDETRRHYTATGIPGKNQLQCTTKKIGVASNYMHDLLNIGDTLPVAIPVGVSTVDAFKPHVLISAGIGITSTLAASQELPEDKLLLIVHVDRDADAHPLKDRLPKDPKKQLNLYTKETGRLEPKALAERIVSQAAVTDHLDDAVFRICGPTQWMNGVYDELKELGVKNLQCEFFASKKGDK